MSLARCDRRAPGNPWGPMDSERLKASAPIAPVQKKGARLSSAPARKARAFLAGALERRAPFFWTGAMGADALRRSESMGPHGFPGARLSHLASDMSPAQFNIDMRGLQLSHARSSDYDCALVTLSLARSRNLNCALAKFSLRTSD